MHFFRFFVCQVDSLPQLPSLPRAFKTSWQIAEPHRRGSGGAAGCRFSILYDCHDCRRNGGPSTLLWRVASNDQPTRRIMRRKRTPSEPRTLRYGLRAQSTRSSRWYSLLSLPGRPLNSDSTALPRTFIVPGVSAPAGHPTDGLFRLPSYSLLIVAALLYKPSLARG